MATRNPPVKLIGYARVSTDEQATDAQEDVLKAAGCLVIHTEHGSGASRARPVLARLMREIGPGDTLVVVRLDRLARSVSHLLDVIERLEERGAHFRSLGDPIDTSTPQGKFTLQVLGAVAELERALISERTKAGVRAAKARGRLPGNPGLRAADPREKRQAAGRIAAAHDRRRTAEVIRTMDLWAPTVRAMRPESPWEDVAAVLNRGGAERDGAGLAGRIVWTVERLKRAVKRAAREGLIEETVLGRAPRRVGDDRLVALVGGIALANPDLTLRDIGAQLEAMRERTPRGGWRWAPSSVKNLLDRAREERH